MPLLTHCASVRERVKEAVGQWTGEQRGGGERGEERRHKVRQLNGQYAWDEESTTETQRGNRKMGGRDKGTEGMLEVGSTHDGDRRKRKGGKASMNTYFIPG